MKENGKVWYHFQEDRNTLSSSVFYNLFFSSCLLGGQCSVSLRRAASRSRLRGMLLFGIPLVFLCPGNLVSASLLLAVDSVLQNTAVLVGSLRTIFWRFSCLCARDILPCLHRRLLACFIFLLTIPSLSEIFLRLSIILYFSLRAILQFPIFTFYKVLANKRYKHE